jgi:undecaprenyl-diphosphatase
MKSSKTKTKKSLLKEIANFTLSSKETVIITTEIFIGVALCFFSLVLFVHFSDDVLERDFEQFDSIISQTIYQLRSPTLTYIMMEITALGSGTHILISSLVGIIFLIKKHKKESILFSLALIMGILINGALKTIIQRPRPLEDALILEKMSSFPSGHAMNAFIFFSLLSYFSYHFFKNKKITLVLSLFSACCILLVGVSRVYLGVHHPTDVLAGYLAGFWWFITVLLVEHTLIFYKLFKRSE